MANWPGKTARAICAGAAAAGHLLPLPKAAMARLFQCLQHLLQPQPLLQPLQQHRHLHLQQGQHPHPHPLHQLLPLPR